jgi:hypothetical protein
MNVDDSTFELPEEQQQTAIRLEQILGKAIADRYVDFWRLCAGAFDLRVSRPLAAHAIRELDSTLRTVLSVPFEAVPLEVPAAHERYGEVELQLKLLGYDNAAIGRAVKALHPRITHKVQIESICERLGLGSQGATAKLWKSISDSAGNAHARSFHQSLEVDDDFRSRYQVGFDTVIRTVAIALEGKYLSLLRRVEQLALMDDHGKAAKLFAQEIPGALPLQRHFFQRLHTGSWLPPLMAQGLLHEPLWDAEDRENNARFTDWPAGEYLVRMAGSGDDVTRKNVVAALVALGSSEHPAVRSSGLAVLAALPISESANLVTLATIWLDGGGESIFQKSAEAYLSNLARAERKGDVLAVARSLLRIRREGTKLVSNYAPDLYQHQLPALAQLLIDSCGADGLQLLTELLTQAAGDGEMSEYGLYSQRPITDDENAVYEIFPALLSAVRKGAEHLVDGTAGQLFGIVRHFETYSQPMFSRLALHVLARRPDEAPILASAYLENPELIDASWCQYEYAELALAWFPSMPADSQSRILAVVDSLSDKYKPGWRRRFTEHKGFPPTVDDERKFSASVYRDAAWRWRAALPVERRNELEKIAIELGDPDAWRERLFPEYESPLAEIDILGKPVSAIVEFLLTWRGEEGERGKQSALAQSLRDAINRDPRRFSQNANLFSDLAPAYVRELFRGLSGAVTSAKSIDWDGLLTLIESLQCKAAFPAWEQTLIAGIELVASGLRSATSGLGFNYSVRVQSLILAILQQAPVELGVNDFDERFERDPYRAALTTLRGVTTDACVLYIWWLSTDATSIVGQAPQSALQSLPEITRSFERELADELISGRIPRAVLGRYLTWLDHFGATWLKQQLHKLVPSSDAALRRAAWISHLTCDRGPNGDLMFALRQSYEEEIALLPGRRGSVERDLRGERLTEYIMLLHIWNPNDFTRVILEQFLVNASPGLRRHALAFAGKQASSARTKGKSDEYDRALSYWTDRFAKAISSADIESFHQELGAFGQWFAHDSIDDGWLVNESGKMVRAGFVPMHSLLVMRRLAKMAAAHSDSVAEVILGLLKNPRTDRWMFADHRPVQTIFEALLSGTSAHSRALAEEAISIFASRGDTSFMALLPSHSTNTA